MTMAKRLREDNNTTDEMLAAHASAQTGSLKVKIMRFTPQHSNSTAGNNNTASWSSAAAAATVNTGAAYNYQPNLLGAPPAQAPVLKVTSSMLLGAPPSSGPALKTENSLAGGGIYQRPPTMEVDTRNFKWLEGNNMTGTTNRSRSGSLPSCDFQRNMSMLYHTQQQQQQNSQMPKEAYY